MIPLWSEGSSFSRATAKAIEHLNASILAAIIIITAIFTVLLLAIVQRRRKQKQY